MQLPTTLRALQPSNNGKHKAFAKRAERSKREPPSCLISARRAAKIDVVKKKKKMIEEQVSFMLKESMCGEYDLNYFVQRKIMSRR